MNYLTAEGLKKAYGTRVLFEDIAFGINKGQRIGFIAKNGTGKTSLLNILADLDSPDAGKISQRKGLRVGLLPQDPQLPGDALPEEVLFQADNEQLQTVRHYEKCLANPEDGEALQEALDKMDRLNAWDVEVKIQQILGKLNLAGLNRKIKQLSGGQKKRIALAKILIENPDLLILDEPTNHLDLDMIEWLENFMNNEQMTLFMVTHDRYFLDGVCNEIWELENGQLYQYRGNYAYYLEKKQLRMENEQASVSKAKNLMRTELEWMRRQPKARGTKSKARIDSFYDLKEEAGKKLDQKSVELEIKMNRLGSKIVELHKLKKSYGEIPIANGFNHVFKGGERLGIIGKNGVGKSTFLNMIMGLEQPDGGKVVTGETVVFGYYTQSGIKLDEDKRVIDVVKEVAEVIPLGKGRSLTASQLLERFLFTGDQQYSLVSKLSGGERKRLYLLTILMKNPNFLILDEPTNDLDIVTLNVLEDFLQSYPGCLLIVSHDRYFMDKLVDGLIVFEGNGAIKTFPGNYTDFRQDQTKRQKDSKQEASKKPEEKPQEEKRRLSYMEKKEMEELEKAISTLESKKKQLTEAFNDPKYSAEEIAEMSGELGEVMNDLEEKEMRWLELSELL